MPTLELTKNPAPRAEPQRGPDLAQAQLPVEERSALQQGIAAERGLDRIPLSGGDREDFADQLAATATSAIATRLKESPGTISRGAAETIAEDLSLNVAASEGVVSVNGRATIASDVKRRMQGAVNEAIAQRDDSRDVRPAVPLGKPQPMSNPDLIADQMPQPAETRETSPEPQRLAPIIPLGLLREALDQQPVGERAADIRSMLIRMREEAA